MPRVELADLSHPDLQPYRSLKHTNSTRWSGRFVIEGHRCVRRLLESHYKTLSVVGSQRRVHLIENDVPPDIPLYVLPDDLAESLLGFKFHAGVIACGQRTAPPRWDDILPRDPAAPALIVACPRTTDPDNLGGLIRLCAGFGATAIALNTGCADPFSRRVLRVSMGNAFHLPIVDSDNLSGDLAYLRDMHGFRIAAAVLDDRAVPLAQMGRAPRQVLLLGNEADGLEQEWIDLADDLVVIPMADHTDSLNVTVAGGIMLHHLTQVSAVR